jgi:hypothetical protein
MMAAYLLDDDIIDGALRSAGELCTVPDDYDPDNIRSIVRRNLEQFHQQEQQAKRRRAEDVRAERERVKKDKPDKPDKPKVKNK